MTTRVRRLDGPGGRDRAGRQRGRRLLEQWAAHAHHRDRDARAPFGDANSDARSHRDPGAQRIGFRFGLGLASASASASATPTATPVPGGGLVGVENCTGSTTIKDFFQNASPTIPR